MSNYIDQFKAARRAGVPIIVIRTADYQSVIQDVKKFYADADNKEVGLLEWDCCRGVTGINDRGVVVAKAVNDNKSPAIATSNGIEALRKSLDKMPERSLLFMMNLQILIEDKSAIRLPIIQAIWNCRDLFKSTNRTLVLLVPDLKLPAELSSDVITIDVPLPNKEELKEIVVKVYQSAEMAAPEKEVLVRAVDAIAGLSSFSAEQVTAMAMSPSGIDTEAMWARKKEIIRQTAGLSVHEKTASFDQLGGLQVIKSYFRQILKGKRPPKLVVLIDEIEKQLGGLKGSSGVEMDAFGVFLSKVQDNRWGGVLCPGFPGTAKSQLGKAMAAEANGLFLTLDFGGMKDMFVGNSEKAVRAVMQVLWAMGGPNVFFIGTSNSMDDLRPELKRRFTYGTFFFDLPPENVQDQIWKIYRKKYNLEGEQALPDCQGWTGAEIEACCERADELGVPLVEAATKITPVFMSMGAGVNALRQSAHNKYLSAEKSGFYDMNEVEVDRTVTEIRKLKFKD